MREISIPVVDSHTRAVLSGLPETTYLPSGLKVAKAQSSCAMREISVPVATSHTRTVPCVQLKMLLTSFSLHPLETTYWPSALKATKATPPSCAIREISVLVVVSHTRA